MEAEKEIINKFSKWLCKNSWMPHIVTVKGECYFVNYITKKSKTSQELTDIFMLTIKI